MREGAILNTVVGGKLSGRVLKHRNTEAQRHRGKRGRRREGQRGEQPRGEERTAERGIGEGG